MCGPETTTTKTEIPPMSEEERKMLAQQSATVTAFMQQMGYDLTPKETSSYKNPALVASLEQQRADLQNQIAELQGQGPTSTGGRFGISTTSTSAFQGKGGIGSTVTPESQSKIEELQKQLNQVNVQYEKQTTGKNATTEYSYDLNLTPYGEKLQKQREQNLDYQMQMTDMSVQSAKKFLSGDYSITAPQKQMIDESMAAIREPAMKMLDEVSAEAERTGKNMGDALNEYVTAINNTGLSVGAALNALDDRIAYTDMGVKAGITEEETRLSQTGQSVMGALQGVRAQIDATGAEAKGELEKAFTIRSILAAKDMNDYYIKNRAEMANKAAMLGRSPMDASFQQELQNKLIDKIATTQLTFAQDEALAKSGLAERTGQRREQLAMEQAGFIEKQGRGSEALAAKRTSEAEASGLRGEQVGAAQAQLAETQGRQLERATAQKGVIAERTGGVRESVAGQKAGLEQQIGQTGQNLRWEMGLGIPAKQVGLGIDVAGLTQGIRQQELANAQAATQATLPQQQLLQNERMAQPTTTQTTGSNIFGDIMAGIGTAAGVAGAAYGIRR